MLEKSVWLHKKDGKEDEINKNSEITPVKELLKKNQFVALVCVGVVLLTICLQVKDRTDGNEKLSQGTQVQKTQNLSGNGSRQKEEEVLGREIKDYQNMLQKEVEDILEKMEGVGSVSVLITLKDRGNVVWEKDRDTRKKEDNTRDHEGGEQSAYEEECEESLVFLEDQNGNQIPLEVRKTLPEVEGVFIVCEGGGKKEIVSQLTHAMEALFHIEPHKIVVVKGKPGKGVKQ